MIIRGIYPMADQPNILSPAERALRIFETHGGILSTNQALQFGIHPRILYALRDDARLERMERGLYRLAHSKPLGNPDLVTAALKVPRRRVPDLGSRISPYDDTDTPC